MKAIEVSTSILEAIARHARATYPDECCGFLIARPDDAGRPGIRELLRTIPVPNEYEGVRRTRFLLRPEELRAAERSLDPTREILAGFYHSHPDHPARPSQFDQDHAWPWYTYLVVALTERAVGDTRGFELDPDTGEFHEIPLRRGAVSAPPPPVSTG